MSKLVRFLGNEVLQRWTATVVAVLFLLVVLPSGVSSAVDDPTVWHWTVVVVAAGATAQFAFEAIAMWRRRSGRGGGPDRPFVAPESVPTAEVESAIASTSDRISAIKVLRERRQGLGLKAAADLVDGVLEDRRE